MPGAALGELQSRSDGLSAAEADALGFVTLPALYWLLPAAMLVAYVTLTQLGKDVVHSQISRIVPVRRKKLSFIRQSPTDTRGR